MGLQNFQIHVNNAIKQLTSWHRGSTHPPYAQMATIVGDEILDGLIGHQAAYLLSEIGKQYPHCEYITLFGIECTKLLMDLKLEMLEWRWLALQALMNLSNTRRCSLFSISTCSGQGLFVSKYLVRMLS